MGSAGAEICDGIRTGRSGTSPQPQFNGAAEGKQGFGRSGPQGRGQAGIVSSVRKVASVPRRTGVEPRSICIA